jgi:hypothetical protein
MWRCVDIVLTDISEEHIAPAHAGSVFYPEDGGDMFLQNVG